MFKGMALRAVVFVFSFVFAAAAGPAIAAMEPYSLWMELAEPDDLTLEARAGEPPLIPAHGRILAFGRMDHEGFDISDISELTVEGPHGDQLPLLIDTSSIITEFGGIVSLRFAFELAAEEAHPDDTAFRILWGGGVEAQNEKTGQIFIDPDKRELYRRLVRREGPGEGAAAGEPYSTIVVIADSTAEYHFLWYLLPMGLLFILLTIRKLRASNTTA